MAVRKEYEVLSADEKGYRKQSGIRCSKTTGFKIRLGWESFFGAAYRQSNLLWNIIPRKFLAFSAFFS